ncbi:beta family protein [Streptomyces sp. NPDC054864]
MAYVPILKGKLGEIQALGHVPPHVQSAIRPLLDAMPGAIDPLQTLADRAMEHLPPGMAVAVDCAAITEPRRLGTTWVPPAVWVANVFDERSIPLRLVVRITSPAKTLRAAGERTRLHDSSAVLRLPPPRLGFDHRAAWRRLNELLKGMRLECEDVEVLIDAGAIHTEDDVTVLTSRVSAALNWLSRFPWQNISVGAGAFPAQLDKARFPRGRITAVPRLDAGLWRRVTASQTNVLPDFADYGVTYPSAPRSGWGIPDPNLRYTVGNAWQVYVDRRRRQGSNDDFFSLCERLTTSRHWPRHGATTSWGDQQIFLCARRMRSTAGNATLWRAWATSHHLAVVTQQLSSSAP